jgi:hypothetical protein
MERTKPISLSVLIPWIAVVCLALAAAWLAELYALARAENRLLLQQKELADLAAQSARNELEAERILSHRPRPGPP